MRRIKPRSAVWVAAIAVILASCSSGAPGSTTSEAASIASAPSVTTTTETVIDTTTSTSSTVVTSPPLAMQGDTNVTVEAFQVLLNCNGFGNLTVDGVFGPATLAAVEAAQSRLGQTVDGAADEELIAELTQRCPDNRRLEGDGEISIVGYAEPGSPSAFPIALFAGSTLTVDITRGTGLGVSLTSADGTEIAGRLTWQVDTTQDYLLTVDAALDPVTFALDVTVTEGQRDTGDWILATSGLSYKGTSLSLGSDAATVIDHVFDFLGHGVRGGYDEFDTGWYAITDPQPIGLRGIFIEGFALLFFGPDPSNPDRPETFARFRFVGPSADASGEPRPADYATTSEGITVGDTLADLKAAYGTRVASGSNSEEFYYRLAESGGVLCFYFGTPEAPTEFSTITEIASECRTG